MSENSTKQTAKIGVDTNAIPNNCIWYESANGEIVEPHICSAFDANILSNTYKDGKSIIVFDRDITEIGKSAFKDCTSLTSITIPDSVTEIGDYAFKGCTSMTSITIPYSVTSIGWSAFSGCTGLTSVTIPDSVTDIGNVAFYECTGLTSFYGKFASEDNRCLVVNGELNSFAPNGLTEYRIPDNVTKIGEWAFFRCAGLTSITIPDSVTEIGESAFFACTGLTGITIPDSVTEIGESAFFACTGLTSVTIPDSVTKIGRDTFSGCTSLTSITIPDSVTAIGDKAFSGCTNLTSFYGKFASEDNRCLVVNGELNSFASNGLTEYRIPDSVTKIGSSAFFACTSLTSITIPDSVTEIGSSAFSHCAGLVNFCGKFASENNRCLVVNGVLKCFAPNGLTEYRIPDGVKEIGNYAFSRCTGLTSITIPNSVAAIGWSAFEGCTSLISIYCKPTTPPTLDSLSALSAFYGIARNAKIYVPRASVNAYKTADGWKKKNYASQIDWILHLLYRLLTTLRQMLGL